MTLKETADRLGVSVSGIQGKSGIRAGDERRQQRGIPGFSYLRADFPCRLCLESFPCRLCLEKTGIFAADVVY